MSSEKDQIESSVASDGSPESTGTVAADLKAVFGEDAVFGGLTATTWDGKPVTQEHIDRLRANCKERDRIRAEQDRIKAESTHQAAQHQSDVDRPATAEDSPS